MTTTHTTTHYCVGILAQLATKCCWVSFKGKTLLMAEVVQLMLVKEESELLGSKEGCIYCEISIGYTNNCERLSNE